MNKKSLSEEIISSFFILIPLLYTILSLTLFSYPLNPFIVSLLPIPIFSGLILLIAGSFYKNVFYAAILRMIGWIVFAGYWATQPQTLYYAEQEDLINASLCIIGLFVLSYFAYREWYATRTKKYDISLQWIAGASAIAGFIYFLLELTPLAAMLIDVVAVQSGWLLDLFVDDVTVNPPVISYKGVYIRIIFACTAVQSMVIFVGMILPLPNVPWKRKMQGLLATVLPVYILNLIRNASITYLVGIYGIGFFGIAHNYIGKGGSLIALIILLLIVTKVVPEIFDQILSLTDLKKNPGPIEHVLVKLIGRKEK